MERLIQDIRDQLTLYEAFSGDEISNLKLLNHDYTVNTFEMERTLLSAKIALVDGGQPPDATDLRSGLDFVREHVQLLRAIGGDPVLSLKKCDDLLGQKIYTLLAKYEGRELDDLQEEEFETMMSLATLADIAEAATSKTTPFRSCLFHSNKETGVEVVRTPLTLLRDIGFEVKIYPDGTFITDEYVYLKVENVTVSNTTVVLHVDSEQYISTRPVNRGKLLKEASGADVYVMGFVSPSRLHRWARLYSDEQEQSNCRIYREFGRITKNRWFKAHCNPMLYSHGELRFRGKLLVIEVDYARIRESQVERVTASAVLTRRRGVHISKDPAVILEHEKNWEVRNIQKHGNLDWFSLMIKRELKGNDHEARETAKFFALANNWNNPNAGKVDPEGTCAFLERGEGGLKCGSVEWNTCLAAGWTGPSSNNYIYDPAGAEFEVMAILQRGSASHVNRENMTMETFEKLRGNDNVAG